MDNQLVFEKKGQAFTNSLIIAEKSENQHESVVRMINNNLIDLEEYGKVEFTDLKSGKRGRPTRMYLLNERQSTLLLTYLDNTEPVKHFKKDLVRAFFKMHDFIQSLKTAKLEFPEFTNAIMNAHEEPKHYHFSNEINMINKIVLGVTAKEFKEQNGIDKSVNSIRPYLNEEQIKAIETLQRFDIGLITMIEDYQERKEMLTNYFMKLNQRKLIA
jgi:phage regulator Rha-like protein|nr:MAG TPA: regulatory protein [Caudoviricetes sp.]